MNRQERSVVYLERGPTDWVWRDTARSGDSSAGRAGSRTPRCSSPFLQKGKTRNTFVQMHAGSRVRYESEPERGIPRSRDINVIFTPTVEEIAVLCARSKGGPRIAVVFTLPENYLININIISDDRREEREIKVGTVLRRKRMEMTTFNVKSIERKWRFKSQQSPPFFDDCRRRSIRRTNIFILTYFHITAHFFPLQTTTTRKKNPITIEGSKSFNMTGKTSSFGCCTTETFI